MIRKMIVHTLCRVLLIIGVLLIHTNGYCRFNLPDIQKEITVSNEDHKALKKFITSQDAGKPRKDINENVINILARVIPDAEISEMGESHSGTVKKSGLARLTGRVIHIEENQQGKSVLAFFVLSCKDKSAKESSDTCDDHLIGIKVEKDTSTIVSIGRSQDCDSCNEMTSIVLEKEIRIGGLAVIGVNFSMSHEANNIEKTPDLVKQEWVQFYIFDNGEVKQAGSLVKFSEKISIDQGNSIITTTYSAGIVFKKDMKGNIIGILLPYTEKSSNGRVDKGMIRYPWNSDQKVFVKE